MRLARNIALTALATIATMALLASAAAAQSIEVHPEDDQTHCGDVSEDNHNITGGCVIHFTSEDNLVTFQHTGVAEAVTSSCGLDFIMRLNEEGVGYIPANDGTIVGLPPACVITACDEPGAGNHPEFEWPITGITEYGASRELMIVTLCFRPRGPEPGSEGMGSIHATFAFSVIQGGDHQIELTLAEAPSLENPAMEATAHLVSEAVPVPPEAEVEFEHIHY